jgi:hypothetical protein
MYKFFFFVRTKLCTAAGTTHNHATNQHYSKETLTNEELDRGLDKIKWPFLACLSNTVMVEHCYWY